MQIVKIHRNMRSIGFQSKHPSCNMKRNNVNPREVLPPRNSNIVSHDHLKRHLLMCHCKNFHSCTVISFQFISKALHPS